MQTATPLRRLCKDCEEWKPLEEFYRHEKSLGGRRRKCRSCHAENRRRRVYGLTLDEMRQAQGTDDCAICGAESTCLDHDHKTGAARGAICMKCNIGLHYLENDGWREIAETYLRKARHASDSTP